MSSGFNLGQLIEQVQNMHRRSDSSEDTGWRDLLCKVVNELLADPSKVSNVGTGAIDVTCDTLSFLVDNYPQLFVVLPGEHVCTSDTLQDRQCFGLTSWVCSHLLRLLSLPMCEDVHSKAREMFCLILLTIKSKCPYTFRRFAEELMLSLAELTEKEADFYASGSVNVPELSRFTYRLPEGEQTSDNLPHRPVCVTDLDTCYRLQVSITKMLSSMSLEICQYALSAVKYMANSQSSLLWATVTCQLEYGETPLKTVSLELLTKLLQHTGLPPEQVLDYFLSCDIALADLLCSGVEACDGDYAALENTLAANLGKLLEVCARGDSLDKDSQFVYERLSLELAQCVVTHSTQKLRTDNLKAALCDTVTQTCEALDERGWTNPLLQAKKQEMVSLLVSELGETANGQYMISFLVACDLSERSKNKNERKVVARSEAAVGTSQEPSTSTSTAVSARGRSRRLSSKSPNRNQKQSETVGEAEGKRFTAVQRQLLARLSALCDSWPHFQEAKILEGIRVILEIFSWIRIKLDQRPSEDRCKCDPVIGGQAVAEVTRTWRAVLVHLSQVSGTPADLNTLYGATVRGIGALLQAIDPSSLEPSVQQFLVWTLSLPWLLSEMSWKDLKPTDAKEATSIATAISDKIDTSCQAICIYLLHIIPKDVVPMWRSHLAKLAVGNGDGLVREAAVRSFPVYLLHSGPNANHLVHEVIHPLLKERSDRVHIALGRAMGPLACVVSRKAVLSRCCPGVIINQACYDSVCIQCMTCDGSAVAESDDHPRDRPRIVDPKMFVPFLDSLATLPVAVKLELIKSLPRLFGHIGIRASNPSTVQMVNQCMELLLDLDRSVRLAFSKAARHLVSRVEEESHAEMDRTLLYHIGKAIKRAKLPGVYAVCLDHILLTVGEIARVAEDHLLLMTMLMLVDHVCCKHTPLSWAVAHLQIKEVAKCRNMMTRQFMMQHARTVLKVVVDHMHDAQCGRIDRHPLDIIKDMAKVFDFVDAAYFLKRSEYMLLPHLVKKATPAASALLRIIARQLNDPNHKGPLSRNVRHIFCHLVCSCESEELTRTLTYLETEVEWDLGTILKSQPNVDFELLLHLATDPDKVLTGLKILMMKLEFCPGPITAITNDTLADVLQSRLLGILVHFDNYLNNGTNTIREKQKAYRSLIPLMQLMGTQHITSVRVRLITTLKIGLNYKDGGFPDLCCRAWNTFIHILDLQTIGPMLPQIAVNLLPLVHTLPKQTAAILEYLIIDNREVLSQHFHELYFLPDIAELVPINTVLKTYTEAAYKSQGLKTHIEHLLKGVTHESMEVRQLALSKLRNLLRTNQDVLHRMVLGSEVVDPIISQIVTTLLRGCRESDDNMRNLYGECLGDLGAVDSGRLELGSSCPKEERTRFQATVTGENFAFDLLNELAKAFLRAEERTKQDCVAYAIQELIQIFKLTSDPQSMTSGAKLWQRFEDEVQEILTPLLQSKYVLTLEYDWSSLPKPIYRSKSGSTFEKWVTTLTGYLASKVKEDRASQVLSSCRAVIKYISQVALYMLPYISVHVLLEGNEEDHTDLIGEILTALHHVKESDTRHGSASDARHGSASDLRHMSAQTVFSLLDHLTRWTRHRVGVLTSMASQGRSRPAVLTPDRILNDPSYQMIHKFLNKIPQDVLAQASYNCSAYSRALMHFEQYLKTCGKQPQTQENLDFLQKLYIALHEPDGVTGITAIKQTAPTLGEQIKAHESMGQLSDASVCYDRAIQLEPSSLAFRKGLLCCRLELGELKSAMDLANGMIVEEKSWEHPLNAYRVEAAWKLGQWDKLTAYLHKEKSPDWNVGLGKILLAARNKNDSEVSSQLRQLRIQQMAPLSAASMEMGSYQRGYDCIVRLQMLNELETGLKTLLNLDINQDSSSTSQQVAVRPDVPSLIHQWQGRLQITQSSYRTQEPILNLRRIMLGLAKDHCQLDLDKEIGQCWLQTAQIARECSLIQTAHSSLLSASAYNLPELCLEKAKWLWDRGDYDKAQSCLEQAIETHYGDRSKWKSVDEGGPTSAERLTCAKMLLLLGRYSEETASWESNDIMKQYKEVQRLHGEWEEGFFYSAKYYDKIMVQLIETDRPEKKGQFTYHVVQQFGQSLNHGSQFIYQSMPRMLTLWLDYGSEVVQANSRSKNDTQLVAMRNVLVNLNKWMSVCCERLAPYQFLTAIPQLISRICHTQPDVFVQLREIMAKLLVTFPQQAVWMMMAVSKSSYQVRVKRCHDIFARAKSMNSDLNKFLQDATKLTDRLLDLCNRNVATGTNVLSITAHCKPLQRLIDDRNFSSIMLPLESLMTPTLPSASVSPNNHDPFPGNQVFIKGIEDSVEVLPSLQKPKKITLRGSDGKKYIMLCKPKDDLRKDARLMEFNGIINKCLRKDAESRRRNLHIRTYTVTPLNEECGLLEWVSNTTGLRNIIMKLYKEQGIYTSGKELKAMQLPANAALERKLDMYRNKLLQKHPAVFSEWFLKTFSDPTSWYNARLAYSRTVAVMSMVGYILGLGDRHGENILFDSTTGDCVHVDFNCLFNKGETFDYPEIVPFRLTHNMVEAMGPMGYEGIFRRACEVTLRVMRDQMDPLMSVLRTFIYDPLVEWSKPARGRSNTSETGETRNEQAQTHIINIESRLRGVLKNKTKPRGLPLSVEGQVNHLIKEATDIANLSQMYIGWAAYM